MKKENAIKQIQQELSYLKGYLEQELDTGHTAKRLQNILNYVNKYTQEKHEKVCPYCRGSGELAGGLVSCHHC